MRLLLSSYLLLSVTLICTTAEEEWSWGSGKKKDAEIPKKSDTTAEGSVSPNVVEEIITSGRDGRMLVGFNDVYQDQDVQDAIASGNDTHARSLVRERLCGLGLMACDEEIEEKRPYIQPQDVIYAQPVHLKPVGRPIAAVPIKGPSSIGYGPPKPIPFPPPSSFGGPPLPPRPYIPGGRPPIGPVYGASRPPAVYEPPYDAIDKKQVLVSPNQTPQQHVHHHYHHTDAEKVGVLDSQGPVYPSASGGIGSGFGGENSLYGNNLGGNGFVGSPTYGGGFDSYAGSSSFYKKELNLNKGSVSSNSISPNSVYNERYPQYETPRADNGADCVCVPFDQCLPHEVLSRKEDGYAIDPRNSFKTNIEAIGPDDVVITDGNGTVVSVKKLDEVSESAVAEENSSEKSSRRRRESDVNSLGPDGLENKLEGRAERKITVDDLTSNGYKIEDPSSSESISGRQGYGGPFNRCNARQVCCRRPLRGAPFTRPAPPQCGRRNTQGINGRIKNPTYIDGDSEFGEYPWQAAILKKDPQESVYVCGGTLIDSLHIVTAAHCIKSYTQYDLRVRLGEWDVNHDVEFYPYIERDVVALFVHPEFYAGTLFNDLAIIRLDKAVDFNQYPHISPACLPDPSTDFSGQRCWTTGWGKDAFGEFGKYQNILKEVDVPVLSNAQCQSQLQHTRLGYDFKLHPGFVCAGGEEGKDACKGDGGGPMVCERGGIWQVVGVVSWGVGCGVAGHPGVYVKVAHYLDWIRQITNRY